MRKMKNEKTPRRVAKINFRGRYLLPNPGLELALSSVSSSLCRNRNYPGHSSPDTTPYEAVFLVWPFRNI